MFAILLFSTQCLFGLEGLNALNLKGKEEVSWEEAKTNSI